MASTTALSPPVHSLLYSHPTRFSDVAACLFAENQRQVGRCTQGMLWIKGLDREGSLPQSGVGEAATDEQKTTIRQLIISAHLNIAQAQIKARAVEDVSPHLSACEARTPRSRECSKLSHHARCALGARLRARLWPGAYIRYCAPRITTEPGCPTLSRAAARDRRL